MRPESTKSAAAGIRGWRSPVPYLFGGLAIMLGLIAIALIILVCSYRKTSANRSSSNDVEKATTKPVLPPPEMEPKFVVIMAGDDNPSFIAKPVS
ncbi:hypothetical protein BVC80_8545g14 [Macleaya cordata]|uniref:Uncharacterized protein n=1 Tax=Macleaya cordata TaxID=56857 RepID=A0A200QQN5_MACCD|nr:hypothetical protein BVC80_8545g14 [Macleaya cordata]